MCKLQLDRIMTMAFAIQPLPTSVPSGKKLRWPWAWIGLLLCLLTMLPIDRAFAGPITDIRIQPNHAQLITAAGERTVALPHRLETGDFSPEGGRVRYQLKIDLAQAPTEPLGIFVRKLSLSGALHVNGRAVGACGTGPLELLRCLHQPHLFVPPQDVWQAGRNSLEFEIFANDRQMNGLGTVVVGNARALDQGPYRFRMLWQVETIHALTWITLTMGVLSLAIGLVLRTESVYLWFGLTSIANAASNMNVLVTTPPVSFEVFSWFVFASRMVSTPLMLMTMLVFFGKSTPLRRGLLSGSVVVLPALVWGFGNARWLVMAIYLPLLVAAFTLLVAMIRWTLRSRRLAEVMMTISFAAMVVVSPLDYLRLGGQSPFEGVYLLAYTSASVMAVAGAVLVSLLASALVTSRRLTATLDKEVALRTADLEKTNARLAELSGTDSLTGIANRRRFDEVLENEWRRARRDGHPLSLLMFDVDHFKHYNDALGHQAGDECLKAVAQTLRVHAARSGDLLARYGGEEFAMLTPADGAHAQRLAALMRESVLASALAHPKAPENLVTISVGVATLLPNKSTTPSDLIRLADEALYEAKRGGRNRVVVADHKPGA